MSSLKFEGGLALPSTFLQTSDKFVTMVTEIAKLLDGDPETVSSKVQDIYNFEKKMAEVRFVVTSRLLYFSVP